jgi:EGF-like domain
VTTTALSAHTNNNPSTQPNTIATSHQASGQWTSTRFTDTSTAIVSTAEHTGAFTSTPTYKDSSSAGVNISSTSTTTSDGMINGISNTTPTINMVSTTPIITTTVSQSSMNTAIYSCLNKNLGIYCNISSDACAMSQPCQNAATCFPYRSLPNGYQCHCPIDYTGEQCEVDQRDCQENTCWYENI